VKDSHILTFHFGFDLMKVDKRVEGEQYAEDTVILFVIDNREFYSHVLDFRVDAARTYRNEQGCYIVEFAKYDEGDGEITSVSWQ
jgi:predicted nucleic-acid-binding protein